MKKKKGKYPRLSGRADQATKPDLHRREKLDKAVHAHDDFEIDIDVETENTSEDEIKTQQMDVSDLDLELPRSSGDEVLPVYVSSKKSLKPTPKQEKPPPRPPAKAPIPQTPIPTSDKQDIMELFDDPENASLSAELPPFQAMSSPSPPVREPDEFEIVRPGENTGVRPLDGDLFDSCPVPRKKKDRKWLGSAIPPPMAHSEQIVTRRFKFTLRDLVLLLLVLILAAALVLTWFIYKDHHKKMELKDLDRGRELIEKSKTEAILETAPEKQEDIPYKGKIETPKEGKSGKKK